MRKTIWLVVALCGVLASPPGWAIGERCEARLAEGIAAARRGDLDSAIRDWSEVLKTHGLTDSLRYQTLVRRGEAYRTRGYYRDAVTDLKAALGLARRSTRHGWQAVAAAALGNAYLGMQRFDRAEPLLERSLELAEGLQSPLLIAVASNDLGNLQAGRYQVDKARESYRRSLHLAERAGNPLLAATVAVDLARIEPDPRPALGLLREAQVRAKGIASDYERARLLLAIGARALRLARQSETPATAFLRLAYAASKEAMTLISGLDDRYLLSEAQGQLGDLYAFQARAAEARSLTERAIASAQAVSAHNLLLRWEWQLARLLRAAGDRQGAIAAYRRAVYHIQSIRMDIAVEYKDGHSSFRETLEPVYLGLADLLLQQARRESQPERVQVLLSEARDTVERLKTAELRDYFKDPCLAAARTSAKTLEEVAPSTAVLYPILLPDRLELLLSVGGQMHQATVPVTGAEVARSARRLARRLRTADLGSPLPYASLAQRLYQWLIAAIAPLLEANRVTTLVYVPDGALRLIPIAALRNGERFLVERYAIVTVPGMTLVDATPIARGKMTALMAGLSEPVQNFPALPGVASEIHSLDRILPGKTLMNERFARNSFESEVMKVPYRVVHIASHGVFGGSSDDSFILTYDAKLDIDELAKLLEAETSSGRTVELLTLSACETAEGDDRSPLGLSGIALKSGARSALGSLWPVEDTAAQRLIPAFYAELKDGKVSKAQALQRAQIELLRDKRFRHPLFWAPFILVGNWL